MIQHRQFPRNNLICWYVMLFYALMLYKYANGMLLFQLQPAFFTVRKDMFTWAFMQAGLQRWLIGNHAGCMLLDGLFYAAPLIYLVHFRKHERSAWLTALFMLAVNWVYVQCYTFYPSDSIEVHIAWLLFPIIFLARTTTLFYVLLDGLRYFFLYFFVSAGIWKLVLGGVFNLHQMTGILLSQHIQLLTGEPAAQADGIFWLVRHPGLSYSLYLITTLIELSFVIGFFTPRFDRLLAIMFLGFVLMDYLLMRLPYFETLPLILTLYLFKKFASGGEVKMKPGAMI